MALRRQIREFVEADVRILIVKNKGRATEFGIEIFQRLPGEQLHREERKGRVRGIGLSGGLLRIADQRVGSFTVKGLTQEITNAGR